MNRSESIKELANALCKAQSKIKSAPKNTENPFFKSTYADLDAVWEACRAPLSDNGLSVSQVTCEGSQGLILETLLLHISGEWLASSYPIRPVKADPQGFGSAMTYARRYSLSAIVGISQADDDGNEATGKKTQTEVPQTKNPLKDLRKNQASGPEDYICDFGKFKGQRLGDITIHELSSYVYFIQTKALEEGKELKGKVLEFMTKAGELLESRKPIPSEEKAPEWDADEQIPSFMP